MLMQITLKLCTPNLLDLADSSQLCSTCAADFHRDFLEKCNAAAQSEQLIEGFAYMALLDLNPWQQRLKHLHLYFFTAHLLWRKRLASTLHALPHILVSMPPLLQLLAVVAWHIGATCPLKCCTSAVVPANGGYTNISVEAFGLCQGSAHAGSNTKLRSCLSCGQLRGDPTAMQLAL